MRRLLGMKQADPAIGSIGSRDQFYAGKSVPDSIPLACRPMMPGIPAFIEHERTTLMPVTVPADGITGIQGPQVVVELGGAYNLIRVNRPQAGGIVAGYGIGIIGHAENKVIVAVTVQVIEYLLRCQPGKVKGIVGLRVCISDSVAARLTGNDTFRNPDFFFGFFGAGCPEEQDNRQHNKTGMHRRQDLRVRTKLTKA